MSKPQTARAPSGRATALGPAWRRRGFTLIELLVVISIIMLLVGIVVPSYTRAKDIARRATCGANLRNLGTAMQQYANMHDGVFPSLYDNAAQTNRVGATAFDADPGDVGGSSRAYYLLVRMDLAPRKMFFCAGDRNAYRDGQESLYDFDPGSGTQHPLSYSLQVSKTHGSVGIPPIKADRGGKAVAADFNGLMKWSKSGGAWEVVRDTEVPLADTQQANSPNHDRRGQNVLYLAGHVHWKQTTRAGVDEDCIWTRDDGSAMGAGPDPSDYPSHENDSVLR